MTSSSAKVPSPTRAEMRWAMLAAAAIVALSCVPYLWGWFLRPADFMGHVYNADDPNVHLAWMRQAAEGRWLFTDRFTSEQQQPQFTHLLFLALGKIAALFGHSYRVLMAVYQAARVLGGWMLLVAVYLLASTLYPAVQTRRLALLSVGLSSGLGWWLTLLLGPGGRSCDYAAAPPGEPGPMLMPEANTFFSLTTFPLFVVSMLVLVLLYLLVLRAFDTGKVAPAVGAGLLGLILGNIHSYDILPVYAVLATYVVVVGAARRALPVREMALAAVVVAISLPAPAYQYFVFRENPIFQQKALTPTLSPSLLHYALTYGLVLVAALGGAIGLRRRPDGPAALLVIWFAVTLSMAYLPVSFQRKMVEGAHIPLAILAASGWAALASRLRLPAAATAILWVALTIPSNLAVMADSMGRLGNNNAVGVGGLLPAYYLDAEQRAALDWLDGAGNPEDVVLSLPVDGCYMPAYCGVTTYNGHWAETIDQGGKQREVNAFLAGYVSDAWRIGFLRDRGIRYVYHGPYEKAWPFGRDVSRFDPDRASYLLPVFRKGSVAIYEVVLP